MKVLVVSHPCANPINQGIFAALKKLTGGNLTLISPAAWRDEFGNQLDEPPLRELAGAFEKVPVFGNGNIILHVYRKNWGRYLAEKQFDLIYMHHEPYALATAQICLANSRLQRPAAFGFYSAQNLHKSYPPPISWLEKAVYRSSRFAFPVSCEVGRVLERKGFSGTICVSPLPVDLAHYYPRGKSAAEVFFSKEGQVVLGYVGRLVEAKGLKTLAAGLGKIRDLNWRMVVIGTGDFREGFSNLLQEEGLASRVDFLGYVPHAKTPEYLSAMDLVVVPSETQAGWKEQFGRIVVEAMACGTMVIGSDSGEIPVLLGESKGGMVFPERDAGALAECLRLACKNQFMRNSLAVSGKEWVVKFMSLEVVAGRMAETMRKAECRERVS